MFSILGSYGVSCGQRLCYFAWMWCLFVIWFYTVLCITIHLCSCLRLCVTELRYRRVRAAFLPREKGKDRVYCVI